MFQMNALARFNVCRGSFRKGIPNMPEKSSVLAYAETVVIKCPIVIGMFFQSWAFWDPLPKPLTALTCSVGSPNLVRLGCIRLLAAPVSIKREVGILLPELRTPAFIEIK